MRQRKWQDAQIADFWWPSPAPWRAPGVPLIRAGTYSFMPPLPATPGTELSGTIEKVGPGVTSRRPGQRTHDPAKRKEPQPVR